MIPYHLESMDFGAELDGSEDFFQMFWPTIISHKIGDHILSFCFFLSTCIVLDVVCISYASTILNLLDKASLVDRSILDEESPLYEVSARDISTKMQFEIILTVEGITPETGNTIQV